MSLTLVLLIVIVLALIWLVFAYNRFVRLTKQSEEAWSDISVQTKRRHDLIPNLVNTVKGYATHEQGTLDKVIQARNSAMSATTPEALGKAENVLTGALKSIFALAEAYPDLKANTNFLQLQKELGDTEDKIMSSRRFYNGTVRDLNTAADIFPSNIIANIFHFAKREFFELENESEGKPVEVKF
ncbi:MAG: LemA family protein [Candidatus Vogelbacteria bacterium]|nr:LemA family protein [Candidatus Vogelbacteria bacterium]